MKTYKCCIVSNGDRDSFHEDEVFAEGPSQAATFYLKKNIFWILAEELVQVVCVETGEKFQFNAEVRTILDVNLKWTRETWNNNQAETAKCAE